MPKRNKDDGNTKQSPAPGSPPARASSATTADTAQPASASSHEGPSSNRESSLAPRWSGGSWRGKASPIAAIARESISASSDSNAAEPRTPAQRLSRSLQTQCKSLPSAAMTKLNISSNASDEPSSSKETKANTHESDSATTKKSDTPAVANEESKDSTLKERPTPAAGWRGWWTRPADPADEKSGGESDTTLQAEDATDSSKSTADKSKSIKPAKEADTVTQDDAQSEDKSEPVAIPARTSWFGLWGSGQGPSTDTSAAAAAQKAKPVDPSLSGELPKQSSEDPKPNEHITTLPKSSSSWAFWSREQPDRLSNIATDGDNGKDIGEIAVAHSPSETKPQPAKIGEQSSRTSGEITPSKKRGRPEPSDVQSTSSKKASLDRNESPKHKATQSEPSSGSEANDMTQSVLRTTIEKSRPKTQKDKPDLVLPEFRNTYHLAETPSYWQQLFRMFGRTATQQINHVSLAPSPHRPHKAIAIGVHGYFPAPLIQRVIGQPTGTSIKFANMAVSAIQKWTSRHDIQCDIEKVALEGEGMIFDRVDTLWSLLLNWIDHIRKADFIMVACHSQGVPVAIMLVAKLLDFGCINPSARVGVCGMAGVNLGPFPSYQSRFLGSSASELFAFSQPSSAVSQRYLSSLSRCLSSHVRIVYVGSIDDQLVSLESATFAPLKHPYLYRAVFVDGRIHAPDFLTHLVGFALKLRNLGIPDHGLLRELSGPLAGSLYTGEGHSRIYEDEAVYDLAVQHALETTTIQGSYASLDLELLQRAAAEATTGTNPYYLPWAMRGLLEEEFVKTELQDETKELLRLFDIWKPTSKVLKDVKFRLEAVKSKL